MTPQRLYINIDHVATVRQARRTDEPDPVAAAALCEAAGAHGITAHLREDRRHMQDEDIVRLAPAVRTVLNLELATSEEIVALTCRLAPYQATIVPERREAIHRAISLAKTDDVVIIAGKGHETYQIFKDRTIHFDDREVVREYLENALKKGTAEKDES